MKTGSQVAPHWPDAAAAPIDAGCAVCGAAGPHPAAVSIGNPLAQSETLHFLRCRTCGSLTATGSRLFEFTDDDALGPAAWRHYLQLGAGIESMVAPLERIRGGRAGLSLLDVGCGFGYTLDYWRSMAEGPAVGLEPSEYGRMGRDMLGAEIHLDYLADAAALRGRRFDVILSSEVIEHVPDPRAFLRELADHLAPGGTLVVTTPNAGVIQPDTAPIVMAAALSPGLHKMLFSAAALDAALHDAGFAHVMVEVQSERLVGFASDAPIALVADVAAARHRYVDYLVRRADDPAHPLDVALGFRFRALKELVNLDRGTAAAVQAAAFDRLVEYGFSLSPTDAGAVRARLAEARNLDSQATLMPLSLGCYLFYRAMLARRQDDAAMAATLFGLAEEVLDAGLAIDPLSSQEGATLLWRAVFERGAACLVLAQAEPALAAFDSIPRQPGTATGARRLAEIGADLPARIALQRAIALLQLGRFATAVQALSSLLAEPAITTPAQREEAQRLLDLARAGSSDARPDGLPARLRRGVGQVLRRLGLR